MKYFGTHPMEKDPGVTQQPLTQISQNVTLACQDVQISNMSKYTRLSYSNQGDKKNANNSSGIQTFVFYLGWVLSQLLVEYLSCVVICCCIDCTIRACRAWFRVRRGEGYWLIEHIRLVGIQGILPQEILKFKPSEMTGSASCGDGGVKPPLPASPAAQSLIIMPMLVSFDLSQCKQNMYESIFYPHALAKSLIDVDVRDCLSFIVVTIMMPLLCRRGKLS